MCVCIYIHVFVCMYMSIYICFFAYLYIFYYLLPLATATMASLFKVYICCASSIVMGSGFHPTYFQNLMSMQSVVHTIPNPDPSNF